MADDAWASAPAGERRCRAMALQVCDYMPEPQSGVLRAFVESRAPGGGSRGFTGYWPSAYNRTKAESGPAEAWRYLFPGDVKSVVRKSLGLEQRWGFEDALLPESWDVSPEEWRLRDV